MEMLPSTFYKATKSCLASCSTGCEEELILSLSVFPKGEARLNYQTPWASHVQPSQRDNPYFSILSLSLIPTVWINKRSASFSIHRCMCVSARTCICIPCGLQRHNNQTGWEDMGVSVPKITVICVINHLLRSYSPPVYFAEHRINTVH
jgi:hypothetical protein